MSSVVETPGNNSVRETVRYGAVFRTSGVRSIAGAMLLARTASEAFSVLLVLFALLQYHSPVLAGLAGFCAIAPGLIVSPVMGAFLDRQGTARMIKLDYFASAAIATLIAVLSWIHMLPAALLLILAALSSLTSPLSFSGMKRAFPALLPKNLWAAGFAIDAITFQVASMIGPVIAGLLIGVGAPQLAMLLLAACWAGGATAMGDVKLGERQTSDRSLWVDTKFGLVYTFRNPTLRGIAASVGLINFSTGVVFVALPVLVLRMHQTPLTVGLLWCAAAFSNTVVSIILGKIGVSGREQPIYVLGCFLVALAVLLLAESHSLGMVYAVMLLLGAAEGLLNIPLWMMRQHRTDRAVLGRVLSISIALNIIGIPVGAAIAGPILQHSVTATLVVGTVLAFAGTALAALLVPATPDERQPLLAVET